MPTFSVVTEAGYELLATDDWVEAEAAVIKRDGMPRTGITHIRGTHPTHSWGPPREGQVERTPRCTRCGGWDNGSYGSHAPCGYEFTESLVATIRRELEHRRKLEETD